MRIKTYFSGTVEAAMNLASRELGGDALLLSARPAGEGARSMGAYEVVFGIPDAGSAPESLPAFLAQQDCHPAVSDRVLGALDKREAADNDVWSAFRDCLRFLPWEPGEPVRLAFVGPAGAGKTSMALKIAMQTPGIRLIDADTQRIGSPLRRAADIAGIGCASVASPDDLRRAAGETKGALLVDLGSSWPKDSSAGLWASAVRSIPKLTICLVLPAVSRTADLLMAAQRFEPFSPQRLVFTHLDETSCAGGVVSMAALTGLPLFAFGTGPDILNGLEPAGERRILSLLFGRSDARPLAAAAGGGR